STRLRGNSAMSLRLGLIAASALALSVASVQTQETDKAAATRGATNRPRAVVNPPPAAKDWADLARLPDWSGVWNPKITDQDSQVHPNRPAWKPQYAAAIKHQLTEEKAGRPTPIVVNCLPQGMPAWMLISHNAMEILFTPGRVTILGESDGNRLRRIYT